MPHIHTSISSCSISVQFQSQFRPILILLFTTAAWWPLHVVAEEVPFEANMEPLQSGASNDLIVKRHISSNIDSVLMLNHFTFRGNVLQPSDGRHNAAHWVICFCPDWFEPCQSLAEPYAVQAAEWQGKLNHALLTKEVRFAKVDCAKEKVLCNEQNIEQYPTVHHYSKGSRIATWRGNRGDNPTRLVKWLGHQLKDSVFASNEKPSATMDIKSLLKKALPVPSERMLDIVIIFMVLGINIRLICSNPELLKRTVHGKKNGSNSKLVEPKENIMVEKPMGTARFLPSKWRNDRCILEL